MCKLFIAVLLFSTVAHVSAADPPAPPSEEEVKAQLVAAGLSEATASEIVAIGKKYEAKLEAAKGDKEATQAVFADLKKDTDDYIATKASSADQTAYAAFVEKKKAEIEGHHTSPAH